MQTKNRQRMHSVCAAVRPTEVGIGLRSSLDRTLPAACRQSLAASFPQPAGCPICRSHSVAVYGVVGIRAEAGSLRPSEGVAGISSVFLVVPEAGRGLRGRIVPFIAAGSQ